MNKDFKIIDLTHSLLDSVPSWDGESGFELSVSIDYPDRKSPDLFRIQKIRCNAGIGTHIDAPAHVIPNGRTVDLLTLEELVVDCVMIDVSKEANENYIVMPSIVENFEKINGEILPNSLVIFYTGWAERWEMRKQYHNNHHFPSIDLSTAEMLLKRNVVGLGVDTFSCDTGKAGFPVHRAVLGANKYLIENIANAKLLPPIGAKVFVLPMKIDNATEAPIRLIALV